MKRASRIVAMVLSTTMILTMVTGCGNNKNNDSNSNASGTGTESTTGKSESGKTTAADNDSVFTYTGEAPITDEEGAAVSILAQNSWYSTIDFANAEIVVEVADRAGVSIDWTLVSPTNYSDSVSPMLAAGTDLPDIVMLPDLDPNMTYIKSGLFTSLDLYLDEYMPNYKKFLDENPILKASLTAEDGHIYYIPQTAVTDNYQPCLMMNMEWLKQLNLEGPGTLDEFVEVLRAFRDNDMNGNGDTTDEIPMSVTADFLPYMFGPAFGLDLVSQFYADDDGTVHYAYAEAENYKAYLTFLNELYEEGLLEIEFSSLTRDQITERCAQNITGVTFDFSWQMSQLYSAQYENYDGTNPIMCGVPPLSGEYEGYYVARNPVSGVFGINAKSHNMELAMKFMDYAMSEESQILYVWGIEGESYTIEADGSLAYTEAASDSMWLQALGINPECLPIQQSVSATDVLLADWHAEVDKELEPYMRAPWPFIYATSEEASTISQYLVDLETYTEEMNVAFITGSSSFDLFDKYVSTLESMNYKEILEIRQAQYVRYASILK